MKVEKWGDDLAVRLFDEIIGLLRLRDGVEVDIRVSSPDSFDISRTLGTERMTVRLRKAGPRREQQT